MKTPSPLFLAAMLVLLLPLFARAQEDDKLTKEVQVVRPYEPSISDASKINVMPHLDDTARAHPKFNYTLALRPVTIDFPVSPIPPAKMVSEPLLSAYNGYVKFGLGNYSSALAEIFYANERSKDYSFGAWFKHNLSVGNVSLDNREIVEAPFSQTHIQTFGKYILDEAVLSANAGFSLNSYRFYAHDTSLLRLGLPIPSNEKQKQQQIHVDLTFQSTYSDSLHVNYKGNGGFRNFSDDFGNTQNSFLFNAQANRFFKKEMLGGTLELAHYARNGSLLLGNNTVFQFSPWVGAFDKHWRIKAGASIVIDANNQETKWHFYPIALASYNIVSNYVIPYFEFGGHLKTNDYASIIAENPWVQQGIEMQNTSNNLVICGGIKGNLNSRTSYNFGAAFTITDSMYFFVNTPDATSSFLLGNYGVVYDNMQRKRVFGELTLAPFHHFQVYLNAEYNLYDLSNQQKPWHLPDYRGQVETQYNIKDKIVVKANVYLEGNRFARGLNDTAIELKGITDINLGLEYRYNRKVGGFLSLNNLLASRHQLWYLYPTQRFNMKLGFSFAF